VAQEIADSLKAKLSPAEANSVARVPTKDTQAYDLFLKGEFEQRIANSTFRAESFDQAARWYKEAIAHDPNFALAIAELAICQLRRHWLTDPISDAEVMDAGKLAKQAVILAPDLAEAHIAVGLFTIMAFANTSRPSLNSNARSSFSLAMRWRSRSSVLCTAAREVGSNPGRVEEIDRARPAECLHHRRRGGDRYFPSPLERSR
jgi:hypothetical protein